MNDLCDDNRFELIEKYKKELIDATNIETAPDEMAVLDDILFRFWQMGWLDSVDRMPLVKESARTLMHSAGNSISAKAFRNAGRFVQNAIDGEPPEFEKLLSAQPERIQNNAVHLCDSCQYTYVTCPSHGNDAVFGDGKGNDNICACNKYRPIFAQPERKKGKWIPVTKIYKVTEDQFPKTHIEWVDATEPDEIDAVRCSECGEVFDFQDARNWCTECGADMRGEQDEID